jgi:polysaccharide export outer membrane protein
MKFSLRTVSGIFCAIVSVQGGICLGQTAPGVAAATAPATAPKKASAQTAAPAPTGQNSAPKPYTFGPLDVLQVSVWNAQNLSGIFDVGSDGTIQYPILGPVKVEGLSQTEAAHMLREKLVGPVFRETEPPEVNVQLLRNNSKKYFVYGQVGHPGEFPLVTEMTVMEALANVGGFTPLANRKKIRILRGTEVHYFNYEEVSKGKKLQQDIKLQNGDRIFVDD